MGELSKNTTASVSGYGFAMQIAFQKINENIYYGIVDSFWLDGMVFTRY